jgi:hypothetical protein
MHRLFSSVVVALMVPCLAQAQRRDPARMPARQPILREEGPPDLKVRDLENLNPPRMIIDRAKELGLSADQKARLDSLSRTYTLATKNVGVAIDTLQNILDRDQRRALEARSRAMATRRDPPTSPRDSIERARSDSIDLAKADVERARVMAARNALGVVLLAIRERFDESVKATVALLTDEQRPTATGVLDAASAELTARLHWANLR